MHETQNKLLGEYFDNYLAECSLLKNLSSHTIKSYRDVFTNFQKIMTEVVRLNDLIPQHVNIFFRRLNEKNHGKLKQSTIRTYYDKLIVFFKWLEIQEHIAEGTMVRRIPKPAKPRYEDEKKLSKDAISKVLSAITLNTVGNNLQYMRDRTIALVLLYTGIRKGELLGLRLSDINWDRKVLFINGKTSKSKKSRSIPIHPLLYKHLKSYVWLLNKLMIRTEYLIISTRTGKPFTEHGLKYWVHKYKQVSNVNFHLHQFRHTFACQLSSNNVDIITIRNLLGHASVKMTERYLRSVKAEHCHVSIETLIF